MVNDGGMEKVGCENKVINMRKVVEAIKALMNEKKYEYARKVC